MKIFFTLFLIYSFLYSEDLGLLNSNYKQMRIKSLAKKQSSNKRVCYIYINIDGKRDWNKYKNQLNTQIQDNRSRCKKYVIYKKIKNVKTNNWRTSDAKNNHSSEYKINLGVIIKENANVDIELYTTVENSSIQNGFFEQKANTGILVKSDDNDINTDNKNYKVNSTIENSNVGQNNFLIQKGIDMTSDFLKKDPNDPFKN